MMNKITREEVEVNGKKIQFEVGRYAQFANAAVVGRIGDTMVLATVVASKKKTSLSYFPLSVEFGERLYAGGKIKGSRWVKREGRPSDEAVLAGRLIDRSIRPLFPKDFKYDVQVVVTVLSVDGENDPDIIALNCVSAALAISDIPWAGPVAATRVGLVSPKETSEKQFLVNPVETELDFSTMDLVVSSTSDKVLMIEAGMQQVLEDDVKKGILTAKEENKKVIKGIENLIAKVGKKKQEYEKDEISEELITKIKKAYGKEIEAQTLESVEKEGVDDLTSMVDKIFKEEKEVYTKEKIFEAIDKVSKNQIRENILTGKRPDGRGIDEVRPIDIEVGLLPRTHGSAIFQRGQTQALSIVTLASPSLEQLIESAQGEETKRYIHHYNMPPYSVGETGRVGFTSRREIGHGALAERALLPVIPTEEKFPYTIRVVSEVTSSNGSTSMASTCGSTLALMDAGVPITLPVAGISIGLVAKADKYTLLTDIIGLEDFSGDMDFKVAGTKTGITAIQLDVKLDGLTDEMIEKTLEKAKTARLFILEKMASVIANSRTTISKFAPKVVVVKVPADKIGAVIGPGGKVIRKIISDTGVTVDVNDEDESVTISGVDNQAVAKAKSWIEGIIKDVEVGEIYEGEVKRILNFGAFVEVLPGKEGLVHVSKMADTYVSDPNEIVKIGDKVKVKVAEIDDQGRINLTMLWTDSRKDHRPRFEDRQPRFDNRRAPFRKPS
ncbi:polyribonucleotide nucleotidyltransferase [Candidatus Gottesmanbacteria bacterium]|nr:polyribonucleotide nucleotidyltransferase [Candidatus Gottesmanbacteria bacterium]